MRQKSYVKTPTEDLAYRLPYNDMIKPGIFQGRLADLDVQVIVPSLNFHLALNETGLAWALSTYSK